MENLNFVEQEEKKELDELSKRLQEKKAEQEKVLKRKLREHNACLREIILNIDEME